MGAELHRCAVYGISATSIATHDRQWAGMMLGDEACACSRNLYRLVEAIQRLSQVRFEPLS